MYIQIDIFFLKTNLKLVSLLRVVPASIATWTNNIVTQVGLHLNGS